MNYRIAWFVILFLVMGAPIALPAEKNPKAETIISEYLTAAGGSKAIAKIQSQIITGNLTEVATGKTGSYSFTAKSPNRFYLETVIEPDQEVVAYNGMSAWAQDLPDGLRTLVGENSKDAAAQGRYWSSRLIDPKKDKLTLQLTGLENLNGKDAYHIRVLSGASVVRDVYFDKVSHLISREKFGDVQFDYSDYRPVQGFQTPFKIQLRRAGREYSISIARAEYNAPVDDSVFAFPQRGDGPLPDIPALLLRVNKNQAALEAMRKDYTCHLMTEEEESSKNGITRTISEFEVFHVGGEEVRRLLVKDGKTLDANDQKKELQRFNKEFDKLTKKQAELAADPTKQRKQEEKDQAELSKFLRAWKFSNARRERFRGHDVIAVDFGPNPEHNPKGLSETFAHSLAGVMWIDEQASQIVRVEARFTDSVKIVGGVLASLDKGSNLIWEQARVNGEVWLPIYDEIHLGGRVLFFKAKANQIDRYSDYKKFRVESKILFGEEK